MLPEQRAAMEAIPVPTHFGEEPLMEPIEIANAMAFIASPEASGINGVVLFAVSYTHLDVYKRQE